jgi:hypothetical protein
MPITQATIVVVVHCFENFEILSVWKDLGTNSFSLPSTTTTDVIGRAFNITCMLPYSNNISDLFGTSNFFIQTNNPTCNFASCYLI